MTLTFTTAAWSWDGTGNNWVSYPKGYNSDGKGLENGIGINGHLYSCPGDLEGIEAANAIVSGKFAKNATTKSKVATFSNQSDYKCSPVASYPSPSTEWDADAVDLAVKTQVATFGKKSYGVKGCTTQKKAALKAAALDKSLNAAFSPDIQNGKDHNLFLDPGKDCSFGPVTADPMDALIEEEENSAESLIAKAKAALTSDEWAMVLAKANGATHAEMAETFGFFDHSGVGKKFKTIHKKVKKATGIEFAAY